MAESFFYIKDSDDLPAIEVTLLDGDGNAVDVSGSTVVFSMANSAGLVGNVNNRPATLVQPESGVVSYEWEPGAITSPGSFIGEFEVTFPDGTIRTWPNARTEQLNVIVKKRVF